MPRLAPLLGTAVRSPLHGATLFQTDLDPVADVVLADHMIRGEVVVPAAGHLAMVVAGALAAAGAGERAVVIEDAVFPRSLALPDEGAHTVQLVLADDGVFTLLSVDSGAIHAEGRVRVATEDPTRTVHIGELRERMATVIEADALYTRLGEHGIVLGASLRWIDRAWMSGSDVLAAIAQPQSATTLGAVNPGLIDACFQATEVLATGDGARLPFAIERLVLRPDIDGEARWVYARRGANQGWDIDVLDEDGRVLLELTGFRDRPATPNAHGWQDCLATVSWRAIDPPPAAASAAGRWLLVADTGRAGPRRRCRTATSRCQVRRRAAGPRGVAGRSDRDGGLYRGGARRRRRVPRRPGAHPRAHRRAASHDAGTGAHRPPPRDSPS